MDVSFFIQYGYFNPFVKIGSKQDIVQRYTNLNEQLRNVPIQELLDSAKYEYQYENEIKQGGKASGLTKEAYIDRFINKQSKQKTPIGSWNHICNIFMHRE